MIEWIKCNERMPEYDKLVLLFGSFEPAIGRLKKANHPYDYFMPSNPNYYSENIDGITHWAELPEAPHD